MKNILTFFLLVMFSSYLSAQTVSIPDQGFEEALITLGIDSDGVVNGQVLANDVENITSLTVDGYYAQVEDLTGIEAFANLEELTVIYTDVQELNLSQNSQLRVLNCSNNWLSSIDVSANILLEELDISNDGEMEANQMSVVDLSNNPNIHTFFASHTIGSLEEVHFNNGNNNSNMTISIAVTPWGPPPSEPYGSVCFFVDDTQAAQNNQFPYSEWEMNSTNVEYHFVNQCNMSINNEGTLSFSIYPNPVTDILNIDAGGTPVDKILLYDNFGRTVLEETDTADKLSVSHLAEGFYVLKIFSGRAVHTEKIIIGR